MSRKNIKINASGINGRGFTLIEVLVALFIFATVSVMAFGGLSAVLKSRNAIEENAARISELQKGMRIIHRDIEQAISRPVRDEFSEVSYGMEGNTTEGILEFTRTGRINPGKLRRSSLQRVRYKLEENSLVRSYWMVLDGGNESNRRDFNIFTEVDDFSVRFLSADGAWSESWPAEDSEAANLGHDPGPPKGVEVTVVFSDFGEVTRLFAVAGSVASKRRGL